MEKKFLFFFPSPHQSLIKTLDYYFSLKCTHFNTVPCLTQYLLITGTLDKKLCFNSGFTSTSV